MFNNINILNDHMNLALLKVKANSNNIANINTPGYKKRYVDGSFKEMLELKLSKATHMGSKENSIVVSNDNFEIRTDGNSIDVDQEISELIENNMQYQSLTRLFSQDVNLKKLILGGR